MSPTKARSRALTEGPAEPKTSTSVIVRVIPQSPTGIQPVPDTVAESLRVITGSPTNHRPRWRWRWNWLAYIPLVPYLVWLMIRHRSPTVFTAANPGIATGGTVGESKAATLTSVERAGGPVAEFSLVAPHSDRGARVRAATRWMDQTGVTFPVIVKPDVGEQGWGVALIYTRPGLERYFDCMRVAIIVQRYLHGIEAGIFYSRRPGAERGRIVSISESTHHQGVRADPCPEEAPSIVFGFTCHDAEYRHALNWNSPQLERAIDSLGRAVPGFFFGRFDVRAASVGALLRGEFIVIELNGVLSESTHIYDPAVNYARACATLFAQWRVAFEIGSENRARGAVPARLRELVKLTAMKIWRQVSARRLRNLARMSLGGLPISAADCGALSGHRGRKFSI